MPLHPCKLHSETYDNTYAKIQKLMTQLDGTTLDHLLISKVLIGKSFVCCSYVLWPFAHLTPPYTLHATSPKKGPRNNPPPIWLKLLKLIASFTTKTMVKMTHKIGFVCKRYQFSGFYVK
jgi:hypothetical protein